MTCSSSSSTTPPADPSEHTKGVGFSRRPSSFPIALSRGRMSFPVELPRGRMSFPVTLSRGRMPVTGTTPAESARRAPQRAYGGHNAGVVRATAPPAPPSGPTARRNPALCPTARPHPQPRPGPAPPPTDGPRRRHDPAQLRQNRSPAVGRAPPQRRSCARDTAAAPPSGRTERRTPAPCPTAPPHPKASPAIPPPGGPRRRHAPGTTPAETTHGARLRAVRRHIAGVVHATARAGDRGGRRSAPGKYDPRRNPLSEAADTDRTGRLHAPHNGRRLR